MSAPYFFFRPLLAPDRHWAAMDWQSAPLAGSDPSAFVECFTNATAAPLARLLPLVAPIEHGFLGQRDFLKAFEKTPVVFVLPESCLQDEPLLAQCRAWRGRGKSLAVEIESPDALRKVPVAAFDTIRFDAGVARQEFSALDFIYARKAALRKIATNVDSLEMAGWVAAREIEWCESYFLTRPNPERRNEPDTTRLKLLKLLTIVREDGDTREIEAIFREEPKLSYNLFRLVNSVAVGARIKISTFAQALAILGRRQLQRWLQLLVYADNLSEGNAPNPLMQLAAARGRQMELLHAAIAPEKDAIAISDNAFLTGLFSLLNVLINLPMSEILKELPLEDEVVDALNSPVDDGVLGHLLSAIVAGEAGDFASATQILERLGIGPAVHAASQVTAYEWAARINIDSPDRPD